MRKRLIAQETPSSAGNWINLEQMAQVEVSSEDPNHGIEHALVGEGTPGWRAARGGEQTIRLIFDEPCRLRLIHLEFEELQLARTQELVLRWSAEGDPSKREIVRQQFNFSPGGSTREVEDFKVNLERVRTLELCIVPGIGGGDGHATLARLRLA